MGLREETIQIAINTEERQKQIVKSISKIKEERESEGIIKLDQKIDDTLTWDELKKISEDDFNGLEKLRFYINKSFKVKGKVTNLIKQYKQKISLIKKCNVKIQDKWKEQLYFLDERIDKRYLGNIVGSLDIDLWLYQFISGEREYILLSEEKLDLEEYIIQGVKIEVPDYADIGNHYKMSLKFPMIFVHTAKKRVIKFSNHKEFFDNLNKIIFKKKGFRDYVFSFKGKRFNHPEYFEDLILAALFSTKFDASPYPLHIIIIGEPGGGKSKTIESIHEKMGEVIEITDGTCSTIKILIPSFKDTIPKIGDLLQSNRMCCIDEFFRILMRVDKEDRQNQLAYLNPLLEHKKRRFGSGNSSFDGQMTSKMIAVTNPIFGTKQIPSLCNKFDMSFLSRCLIYYQDEEHYEFITDISEEELKDADFNMDINDWLSFYDYLNSFQSIFDKKKIKEIFNSYIPSIEQKSGYGEVLSMYRARYLHHITCIMDGLIKLRCIEEQDELFIAKDKDYDKLKQIWEKILINWGVIIVSKV